uniref:G-protein coupled receptors family 1 profile domain-containing protein n=1 Tax=Plectus sambesii TaxID=2011161 RepID=A0A914UJK1_9BILA
MSSSVPIVQMKPPVAVDNPKTLLTSSLLMWVCLLGMCGNVYGMTKAVCMSVENGFHRIYLLVALMCFSELCVSITLPMTVIDQLLGFWMFGDVFCRFYLVFGSFGKILTPLLLAVLSIELTFPHHCLRFQLRDYAIAIIATVICLLVLPVLFIYGTQERLYAQHRDAENLVHIVTTKCGILVDTSVPLYALISAVSFLITFIMPACLFVAGERDIRIRAGGSGGSALLWYWRAANLLYLLCWGPVWALIAFSIAQEAREVQQALTTEFKTLFYAAHALPLLLTLGLWALLVPLASHVRTLHRLAGKRESVRRRRVTRQDTDDTRSMSTHFDTATSLIRNIKAGSLIS